MIWIQYEKQITQFSSLYSIFFKLTEALDCCDYLNAWKCHTDYRVHRLAGHFLAYVQSWWYFQPSLLRGSTPPPLSLGLSHPFELFHPSSLFPATLSRESYLYSPMMPLSSSLLWNTWPEKLPDFAFNNVASRITYKRTWHVKKAVFCARLPTGRPQHSSDLVPFFRNNYEHFPWVSKSSGRIHGSLTGEFKPA